MAQKITAATIGTDFGQIMDRAVDHNDRFVVERNGEPALVIMSVVDFIKTLAPAPDWLRSIQSDAMQASLDELTLSDIDEEIAAARARRRDRTKSPGT